MLSLPLPLVVWMIFFGVRTRLRPLTAATRADLCPSLTAFPFQLVLMLHPFHQNPASFAVWSLWSRCPDHVPFHEKSLSFSAAGWRYHTPPIALCVFGLMNPNVQFTNLQNKQTEYVGVYGRSITANSCTFQQSQIEMLLLWVSGHFYIM